MRYYEEETRVLSAILLSLYTTQDNQAFTRLEHALQRYVFPSAVRRLCEDALNSYSTDRAKAISRLLKALESISGYKYVERYIAERNQSAVCGGWAII